VFRVAHGLSGWRVPFGTVCQRLSIRTTKTTKTVVSNLDNWTGSYTVPNGTVDPYTVRSALDLTANLDLCLGSKCGTLTG